MLAIARRVDVARSGRGRMPDEGGRGVDSVDYYRVLDQLISATISSDPETYIRQVEQENGQ